MCDAVDPGAPTTLVGVRDDSDLEIGNGRENL